MLKPGDTIMLKPGDAIMLKPGDAIVLKPGDATISLSAWVTGWRDPKKRHPFTTTIGPTECLNQTSPSY